MTDLEYLKKYLDASTLDEAIKRLKDGEPVQYIVGNVDFCGNIIDVNKNVLIPRFETELLVEKTYNYIKKHFDRPVQILEIGTGSGAIAISLKKMLNCHIDAIDISPACLEVASKNALKNKVEINFFLSDVFSFVSDKYDVIISNPPYIAKKEKISDIVKNNEPEIALFANNNGLEFYEKILKDASNYVHNINLIAFEIGESQGKEVSQMAKKYFPKCKVFVEKDYCLRDRFVFIFNS